MSPLGTAFFVSATILEVIVMMNLLIAIVSATFERVNASSVQYSFKEKVSLISDIYASVKFADSRGVIKGAKNNLMFLVREDEKNKEAIPDDEEDTQDMTIDEKVDLVVDDVKSLKAQMMNDNSEAKLLFELLNENLIKLQASFKTKPTTQQLRLASQYERPASQLDEGGQVDGDRRKAVAKAVGANNLITDML